MFLIELKKKTLKDLTKEELIRELEAKDKAIKYLSKELENVIRCYKEKVIIKEELWK